MRVLNDKYKVDEYGNPIDYDNFMKDQELNEKNILLSQLAGNKGKFSDILNVNMLPEQQRANLLLGDILTKGGLPNNDRGTGSFQYGSEPAIGYRDTVRSLYPQSMNGANLGTMSQGQNLMGGLSDAYNTASQVGLKNLIMNPTATMNLIKKPFAMNKPQPSQATADIDSKLEAAIAAGYTKDQVMKYYSQNPQMQEYVKNYKSKAVRDAEAELPEEVNQSAGGLVGDVGMDVGATLGAKHIYNKLKPPLPGYPLRNQAQQKALDAASKATKNAAKAAKAAHLPAISTPLTRARGKTAQVLEYLTKKFGPTGLKTIGKIIGKRELQTLASAGAGGLMSGPLAPITSSAITVGGNVLLAKDIYDFLTNSKE